MHHLAARLTAIEPWRKVERRIGIAAGMFEAPADPHADDEEVAELFFGPRT